jgi:hypothetical protein
MHEHPHDPFTIPLPPGLHAEGDVMYFGRHGEPPTRDHEDIMLRRVPKETAARFRGAAGARGFTHAQYLAALVQLHEAMRAKADGGDQALAEQLEQLGLSSITI